MHSNSSKADMQTITILHRFMQWSFKIFNLSPPA